jgi:hypothetical protein
MHSKVEKTSRFSAARTRALLRNAPRHLFAAAALVAAAPAAYGGAEIKINDNTSISIGLGLRASYTNLENGSPDGKSSSNNFAVENVRLFTSGQFSKTLKATFNTERTGGAAALGGDSVRVMDAIAQFEPSDVFNVWLGRMLPPSDRANLSGPFYVSAWSFPGVVSNYPAIGVGRDNGMLVWGKPMGGQLVYSVGAFNGHNREKTLSNTGASVLYAARLAVALWAPEPAPAYYEGGTYYGSKDILTIGFAGQMQKEGVGSAVAKGDYKAWSVDALLEKKLSGGLVPTLEGAYYKYDLGGALDCGSGEPGAALTCPPAADNVGGQVAGKAMMISGALLLPTPVGRGQFQPFLRYQKFDRDVSKTTIKATDVGVNYLLTGTNARISAVYTKFDDARLAPAKTSAKQFILGVQLVY